MNNNLKYYSDRVCWCSIYFYYNYFDISKKQLIKYKRKGDFNDV